MKVFVVNGNCDEEYGCMEIRAIFSTREKADEYVAKNQWYWKSWLSLEEKEGLEIEE